MVWHSNLLVSFMTGSTGHPFQNIPILQNPTLLQVLKQLVTCDPCNGVMMPSGVPRHIKNLKLLYSMLHQLEKTLEAIMNLTNSLPQIVCDAISQKAAESGHMSWTHWIHQPIQSKQLFKQVFTTPYAKQ
jgi:hypothetical protein